MRVISSIQFDGVEYLAVWAPPKSIDKTGGTVRQWCWQSATAGTNHAIIPRNAKLADVES